MNSGRMVFGGGAGPKTDRARQIDTFRCIRISIGLSLLLWAPLVFVGFRLFE